MEVEGTNLDEIREFATLCNDSKTADVSEKELSAQLLRISQYLSEEGWKSLSAELQSDLETSMRQILSFAVSELEKSFPRQQYQLVGRIISCYVEMNLQDELLILVTRIVGGSPAKYSLAQRLSYSRLLYSYLLEADWWNLELIKAAVQTLSRLMDTTVVETEAGEFQVRDEAAKLGGGVLCIFHCFDRVSSMWNTHFRNNTELTQEDIDFNVDVLPPLKRMYRQIGALSRYYFDLVLREFPTKTEMYGPMSHGRTICLVLNYIHCNLSEHPKFQDTSHVSAEFLERGLPNSSSLSSNEQGSIYLIAFFMGGFLDKIKETGEASRFSRRCFYKLSELFDELVESETGAFFIEIFFFPKDEMGWRADSEWQSLPTIQSILQALMGSEAIEVQDQRIDVGKPFTPKVLTQTYKRFFSQAEQQSADDEDLFEVLVKWAISGLRHPTSWFTRFCAVLFFYQSAPQSLVEKLSAILEQLLREETSSAVLLAAATFGNTLGSEEDIVKNFRRCKERAAAFCCYRPAALIFGERILQIYDEERDCALQSSSDLVNPSLIHEILEFGGQSRPAWLFKNSTCAQQVMSCSSLWASFLKVLNSYLAQDTWAGNTNLAEFGLFATGFARFILSEEVRRPEIHVHRQVLLQEEPALQGTFASLLRRVMESLLSGTRANVPHLHSLMPALTILLTEQSNEDLVLEIASSLKLLFIKVLDRFEEGLYRWADRKVSDVFLSLADGFFSCQMTSQLLSPPEILQFLNAICMASSTRVPLEKLELLTLQRRAFVLLPFGTALEPNDLLLETNQIMYAHQNQDEGEIVQIEMKDEKKWSIFETCVSLYWEALNRGSIEVVPDVSHFFASQMFRCLTHPSQDELKQILALDQSLLEAVLEVEEDLRGHYLHYWENSIPRDMERHQQRCAVYCAVVLLRPSEGRSLKLLLAMLSTQVRFSLAGFDFLRECRDISFGLCYLDFWHQTFGFITSILQRLPEFGCSGSNEVSPAQNQSPSTDESDLGDQSIEDDPFGDLVRLVAPAFLRFLDQLLIPISFPSPGPDHLSVALPSFGPHPNSDLNLSPPQVVDSANGYTTKLVECCTFCEFLLAGYSESGEPRDQLREFLDQMCEKLFNEQCNLQSQPMWFSAAPMLQEMRRKLSSDNNGDESSNDNTTPPDDDESSRKRLEKQKHREDAEEEPAQKRRRHE